MFWENYLLLCSSVGKAPNAVAAEIGIKSSGTVTGWSNGAIPRKSVLFKLCQYFGVTEEQLLSDRLLMDPVPPEQSTRGMTPEEREAYYRGQHLDGKKEKPTPVSESGRPVNIVKIAGRDGSYAEKRLTDEQVKALQTIIDQMPEAPDDL